MATERVVRLFRNGRNQAVRIPVGFELPGVEAVMRKEGNRLVIEAIDKPTILEFLAGLKPIDDSLPDVDEKLPPMDPVSL